MGVGFAISSNLAKVIANQLIEHGEVTGGYLGIVIQQLASDLAESFGIDASQGVLVAQVSNIPRRRQQTCARETLSSVSKVSR